MKICFPTTRDLGLDSPVSATSAPRPSSSSSTAASREIATLFQTAASRTSTAPAGRWTASSGEEIDAVVVGGIGPGALERLHAAGIAVLRAGAPTVRGCLDEIARGEEREVAPADACAAHAHEHGPAAQ